MSTYDIKIARKLQQELSEEYSLKFELSERITCPAPLEGYGMIRILTPSGTPIGWMMSGLDLKTMNELFKEK